jgi:LPXTG-motif cell wall-anchored protein
MGRAACALILLAQLLLIWVAIEPTGTTAIWFSFVGTPLLVSGCALVLWRLRVVRRERDSTGSP